MEHSSQPPQNVVRRPRFRPLVLAALALGLALPALGLALAPLVPGCALQQNLGLACPGCGLGRAALALSALDPLRALTCYPPLALLAPAYLLLLAALARRAAGRESSGRRGRAVAVLGPALAALITGNWILKLLWPGVGT